MTYTVTDDYIRVFGSTTTVQAGTNWKSRKELMKFLESVTKSGGPLFAISGSTCFNTYIFGIGNKEETLSAVH